MRPSLLSHRSTTRLGFSSVSHFSRIPGSAQRGRESPGPWWWSALKEMEWRGDGLKGSVWRASHCATIPILAFQTQAVPPSTAPGRIPQHSLHRSLFSATSLPTPPSPDKPVHSADEESSLSSGTNVWQVNFKVAHEVEATESYTTVKKQKCCWINSASNGCVTENTLKIQALCIRRQALWFWSRNCEGSLELGLTGVQ